MASVTIIPPREKTPDTLRIAAYCRVSSDSSDQLHSYASQIRKYTTKISEHGGWELVDIYADEAVTGTRADKREDFNRMLSDCRKGKIDKILVKSISRFARNTKDCLVALRELSALGVTVHFEKENINTETLTSELMVSVFGSLAQEESISIGKNQRISYQGRMERGEFITCCAPFGYQLVDGKYLVIDEKEAEIVRWIFDSYLSGCSTTQITAELNRKKIPTVYGGKMWHQQVVKKILVTTNTRMISSTNEKSSPFERKSRTRVTI
jgi:DNA invertase Pin-like site-specific DNA recombinase